MLSLAGVIGEVTHKFPTKYNVGQVDEILNKAEAGAGRRLHDKSYQHHCHSHRED